MGNGHPLAAVVTRPEIAEVLANETGYFNTFGGNPVSCAAGLAVLDVIEKEGLQQNANEVGQYLKKGIGELQKSYPLLGQVHGSGLLLGIDINTAEGIDSILYSLNRMRCAGSINFACLRTAFT